MQDTRRPRKAGDLDNSLERHLKNLVRQCRSFDAGAEIEAGPIATKLRTLLHHNPGKKGFGPHSLLVQLNYRDRWQFVDSGIRRNDYNQAMLKLINDPNKIVAGSAPSDTGLVTPGIVRGQGKFIAPLMKNRFGTGHPLSYAIVPHRSFTDWWSTPFIETLNGKLFSRMNIVMTMANQEDAHVDPEINADFDDFCQDSHGLAVGTEIENVKPFEPNIVYATIRQIAFEVMATVDENMGSDWVEKTGNLRDQWQPMLMPLAIIANPSQKSS